MSQPTWQFWIDRGGTFTDVVAVTPRGALHNIKLLSENPEHYSDAVTEGIRRAMGLSSAEAIPSKQISRVKMGTTVATNALLERKGAKTLLVITRGFADALRIGYQNRPDIFARHIQVPHPLYSRVLEVEERLNAEGQVLIPLNPEDYRAPLQKALDSGITAVAIVFMHAYRNPAHEQAFAALAGSLGFQQVTYSHQASPLIKLVGRGDTTVVDAYLSPVLRRYVAGLQDALPETQVMFMQSSGGLTGADHFQGRNAILSGPAGGIVGGVKTSLAAGFERIIGFDMGGTSTDVWHYCHQGQDHQQGVGSYERVFESTVAGARLRVPMMAIHTVAAGGGSICRFDGSKLRVGPESAGADPGPASYRRGGPLALTDCNLMLGKLVPEFFPAVFGPNADQPLEAAVVRRAFRALADNINGATGGRLSSEALSPEDVAEGFIRIAVQNMAGAIKTISTQRGHDVSRYVLACFGGAGGQHACGVAEALGMETILIHPLAGVLSAYGMGLADITAMREQTIEKTLDKSLPGELEQQFQTLEQDAVEELLDEGADKNAMRIKRRVHIKYAGSDTSLEVDYADRKTMAQTFAQAHKSRFSFLLPDRELVVEGISLEAGQPGEEKCAIPLPQGGRAVKPLRYVSIYSNGKKRRAPVYPRNALGVGWQAEGPAIILEDTATTVVEPGWQVQVIATGHLQLCYQTSHQTRQKNITDRDPVLLEIFNNLFMSIAEQMGAVLANTAHSVNIKERLDFSCALFDQQGELIANAPHMPVHLGSMGETVKALITANGADIHAGDVFLVNSPYAGGTHLPDMTVVTPVFDEACQEILFYVASRAHHADVGGTTPGSIPPYSKHIDEEGVLIENFRLVSRGEFQERALEKLLASGSWPVRNLQRNIADLQAQIAANEKGVVELRAMVETYGLVMVQAYMSHVQDNAEEAVRRAIGNLRSGRFEYPMDNGAVIRVAINVDKKAQSALIDFSGTSPQMDNNFNAPAAVCKAAVLYVFRTLVDDAIPLNAGCLKPLVIRIPEGSILNPVYPAAVVAGNVETSQYVVDALYGALGVLAGSQGTMNNLTFGNDKYQYYETICGGAGAGPDFPGASAVQVHMTNSRLTDPEVLELRFPVRVEAFSIRRGSGGKGRYSGGDGVVRKLRFLEPMMAAIVSGHRQIPTFGVAGGGEGACGRNLLCRASGEEMDLTGTAEVEVGAGDLLVVETPGGGGYNS